MKISDALLAVFRSRPKIKLAYLFGSRAAGRTTPLSDYDFAVFLDEQNSLKRGRLKLDLITTLSQVIQTDRLDLVILNENVGSELKYHIIKDGHLIYEVEPYRVIVEPRILNEYFDFRLSLRQYGLTRT